MQDNKIQDDEKGREPTFGSDSICLVGFVPPCDNIMARTQRTCEEKEVG